MYVKIKPITAKIFRGFRSSEENANNRVNYDSNEKKRTDMVFTDQQVIGTDNSNGGYKTN